MAVAPITQKFAEAMGEKFMDKEFATTAGRKYDRVVITFNFGRSVHAFVERETGHLYKAAGWAAPAKDARFDLSTDEGFAQAIEVADPYGSYLYKR